MRLGKMRLKNLWLKWVMLSLLCVEMLSGLSAKESLDLSEIDEYMSIKSVNTKGIRWHEPKDEHFQLLGFKWYEKEGIYRRLPKKPVHGIPYKVDRLANATAGGQIRFKTNSKRILLRAKLASGKTMSHMADSGRAGFDLYTGPLGKQVFRANTRFPHGSQSYICQLHYNSTRQMEEYTVHFPLYSGVQHVEIGLDEGAKLLPPTPLKDDRSIVIYGTSITQGGCATRPGMAYPNILSRYLGREVVNLGFSGSGKGEPEIAKMIWEIDNKSLVVIDIECNTHESLRKVLEPFIETLRQKDPVVPILVLSRIRLARDLGPKGETQRLGLVEYQRSVVEKMTTAGDSNLYFLDGGTLLREPWCYEATVDGTHPTDLGFVMMADALAPELKKILQIE